ncbi:KDM8 [Branchiostoma lanceolatum]|uniref:KDM8 protein n=1 Tax=Branchiostoma lanceolatum TaxID=7740 RepID=A0A8J9YTF4_BRALA|nr:KDM8 [Branchiostoma lanceolatum]
MSQPVDSDCEEISEWPPRDTGKGSSSDESEDKESVRHICEEKGEGRGQKYIRSIRQASLSGAGPDRKRAKLCESDEDVLEDSEPAAQASLARWWRREGINTGRKRWLFFQKEDLPLLYPCYNHSTDPTFDVDVFNPDLQKYPLLSQTHPRECILQPGELLFVPAGCPHRVENLDKSLAVSGNFVDESNIQVVKQELRINALKDLRALDLLQQFSDSDSLTNIP